MNQVSIIDAHVSFYSVCMFYSIAPSDSVLNVMVSNVTDVDDIAVSIEWDPPTDPNGFIRYYHIVFQQTSEVLYGSGGSASGTSTNGCPPINTTIIEERVFFNETTDAPTMIIINGLG